MEMLLTTWWKSNYTTSGIHELHYPAPLKTDSNQSAASTAFSRVQEHSDQTQPPNSTGNLFFFFLSLCVRTRRCYCSVNQCSVRDWARQLNNEQQKVAVKPKGAADTGDKCLQVAPLRAIVFIFWFTQVKLRAWGVQTINAKQFLSHFFSISIPIGAHPHDPQGGFARVQPASSAHVCRMPLHHAAIGSFLVHCAWSLTVGSCLLSVDRLIRFTSHTSHTAVKTTSCSLSTNQRVCVCGGGWGGQRWRPFTKRTCISALLASN